MKFSVVTVCFNAAHTIARTLESVACQTYPNIEHIVIDGASTDGTLDIIEHSRPKLAKVISEPDSGIYDAMNKGLKYCTGDIICFLNSDDLYASSEVLSKVASLMQDHKLDALMGDVAFFYGDSSRIVRRYNSDQFHPDRLAWGWMPAHPALFLSKATVNRVGYFKTDYRIAADYEFVARAFHGQALNYRHIPEVLVLMQTGGVSTAGWRNTILLNQEVLRACRENNIQTSWFKILSKYPAKLKEFFSR